MIFLRFFGLLLGVLGLVLLLIGITFGSAAVQDIPLTHALFAILVGLLLATGAYAGERLSARKKAQNAHKEDNKSKRG